MGQALYDAQAEFFRNHAFYDADSLSPFLIVQKEGEKLYRLDLGHVTPEMIKANARLYGQLSIPASELRKANTIEEIEDHYISAAPLREVDRPRSIFSINAQGSVHGSYNRRGVGWIVLMHPDRFSRLLDSMTEQEMQIWTNVFPEDEQLKIGRWALAANKVDRQQHIWVSPHLSQDEVVTVYRDGNSKNIIDGLPVMVTSDGFLYPEESQKDYILRWKYNA